MRRQATSRLAPALLAAAVAASAATALPARAQAPDQGKTLFVAGAQAYEAGQFAAAIQAFEQSYRLSARPGVLFSLAQAHRKQYYLAKQPEDLRAAVRAYRDYLAQVVQGGRRSDAVDALAELEPLVAKLDPAAGATISLSRQATRLMVSSQTGGASVSLDGGKPMDAPLIAEVRPGKHALRIVAAGFFDEARDIEVAEGSVAAIDIPLREKPGKLSIRTGAGAQVTLDGRFVATTPLGQPLDVEPGRHLVALSKNGYHAYTREIEIARDETKSIEVTLTSTTQRKASFVLVGAGAALAAVGGVLAILAIEEQAQAHSFQSLQNSGTAQCGPHVVPDCVTYVQSGYTDHVNLRDSYRLDAGVAFGAAVVVAGTGVALFTLDLPAVAATFSNRDTSVKPAPRPPPLEISTAPLVAPGLYGGSLVGRF